MYKCRLYVCYDQGGICARDQWGGGGNGGEISSSPLQIPPWLWPVYPHFVGLVDRLDLVN